MVVRACHCGGRCVNGVCTRCGYNRNTEKHKKHNKVRPDQHAMYHCRAWYALSAAWRKEHPLCKVCEDQGRVTPATQVDHIQPHLGNPDLFWDRNNLQSICNRCHSIKTARERG